MLKTLNQPKLTVIRPQGCLNATNAWEFEQEMTSALVQEDTSTIVLVDLGSVEAIDSAGLMALVSALKLADSLGRTFRLSAVSPTIRIIFELTQLDRVFEIF
ncbi:STAS domain-containing protein [Anabaena lutea]|uniref:Anti-sigma factor antagonist n=1 Tax=Anabaena lutea FACHB-196 TaxID=2692881 RepID=A0ABR8FEU3_9NOST|nr:STAS domain-containing protein [Anabaena lutea]MBD2567712.1 STAS domain-containing protein [Anabaena lutea FACHB-196]